MNNLLLQKAHQWLTELGVTVLVNPDSLMINLEQLCQFSEETINVSTKLMLEEIRLAVGSNKVFWGKTVDGWIYLESF